MRRASITRTAPGGVLASALLAACSSGTPPADAGVDVAPDAALDGGPGGRAGPSPADCDPLDEAACALPWPSNLYLAADPSRPTGYTLRFGATSLPPNARGRFADPAPYARLDGYGVGTPIMAVFPDVDLRALATEDHPERSLAPDAAIALFRVRGGALERVPYFVELDGLGAATPEHRPLLVRPAVILDEATRYVVAFRGLTDTRGTPLAPSAAFRRLRDGAAGGDAALARRQPRFDEVFGLLEGAGVPRASLTLAWDFVTASDEGLHGRMLALRDDALARVGPTGPALTVTDVTEFAPADDGSGRAVNALIAFELHGTFAVPSYLRPRPGDAARGDELNLDAAGRPVAAGTRAPEFWVRVPRSALGGEAHGLMQYGHGLFGSGAEVRSEYLDRVASDHHLLYFAANLTGMSGADVPRVAAALSDVTDFLAISDPLHQGLVEWLLLARAMRAQLGALPALTARGVTVDPAQLFYSGNSQGGIFGASYVALSTDITRGHLGVPGNNYVTLLPRSSDFGGNLFLMSLSYPRADDAALALAAMQLLWDDTDPVSYYRHLRAAPFAGTPAHDVLLAPAKGDPQVAVVTDEIAARSGLGLAVMAHYDPQRAVWGVTEQPYPYRGSGMVLWDFGNAWPAPGDHPPADDGRPDPHELPRRLAAHNEQMVHFLRTGEIVDVCGGDGCHPD